MAPGCYTTSQKQTQNSEHLQINLKDSLSFTSFSSFTTLTAPLPHTFTSSSEAILKANPEPNHLFISYSDEINLDDIPLPLTPPPNENHQQYEKSDSESQREEDPSETKKKNSNLFRKPKLNCLINSKKKSQFNDTVDSFEILEQTILKQKRLSRFKNTDLRKKILLKRTFDLVCEIMDHENGFEADEVVQKEEKNVSNDSSYLDSESDSDSNSDESESESDESDSDEDEIRQTESLDQLLPKQVTLVKLDECELEQECGKSSNLEDLYLNLDLVEFRFEDFVNETESTQSVQVQVQAQVPKTKKRRSSNCDSDEDEADECEEEEEDAYDMDYVLKDQQLNSFTANLVKLNSVDLNLYNDNNRSSGISKRRAVKRAGGDCGQEHCFESMKYSKKIRI